MGRILDGKWNSSDTPGKNRDCRLRGDFQGPAGVEWPTVREVIAYRISSSRLRCYWFLASSLLVSARFQKSAGGREPGSHHLSEEIKSLKGHSSILQLSYYSYFRKVSSFGNKLKCEQKKKNLLRSRTPCLESLPA